MRKNNVSKKHGRSRIASMISKIINKLALLICNSCFISFFIDYKKIQTKYNDSKTSFVMSSFSNIKYKTINLKTTLGKYTKNSFFVRMFDWIFQLFFRTNLRTIGVFMFTWGAIIIGIGYAKFHEIGSAVLITDTFLFGCLLTFLSVFLLPFKAKSVSYSVKESKILSVLFLDLFHLKHITTADRLQPLPTSALSFIFGLAFGGISSAISPIVLVFVIAMVFVLYLIFTKPENGILLLCLFLPMLSDNMLTFLILITAVSYLAKILIGKRTPHINICTGCALFIGVIALSLCMFSYDKYSCYSSVAPILLSLLLTILVIMQINSTSLVKKCFKLIGVGIVIATLFGIYQAIISRTSFANNSTLESGFLLKINSFFENSNYFAAFIIATIPFFVIKHKCYSKTFTLVAMLLSIVCLFFTDTPYAVFASITGLVISVAVFSKYGKWIILGTGSVFYLLSVFLPSVISNILKTNALDTFINKNNFTNNSICLTEIVPHFGFSGTGAGTEAIHNAAESIGKSVQQCNGSSFSTIVIKAGIPLSVIIILLICVFISRILSYSLEKYNSDDAKKKCIVVFCSIISLIFFGFYSDYINSFKTVSLLFLLLGLGSATTDSADSDYISPNYVRENI